MYQSLQDRLRNQHEAIRFIITGCDASRLTKQLIPGKWSIKDQVVHLAKYQPVFMDRIKLILTGQNPVFERYKAENDPEFETWRQYALPELLDGMDRDREVIFNTISYLKPEELGRTGIHKKFGTLSITGWTEFFLLHEAHHIFAIFQLLHDRELGFSDRENG